MKRFVITVVWLCSGGIGLAQSTGEFQGLYQHISGLTFNSGSPSIFDIENASTNGGGYAISYNLDPHFGVFQQMGFFGNVSDNGYNVRLITELQGFQVTKSKGPFELYAKGGMGISIWSFSGNLSGSSSNFALNYGAGAEVKMTDSLYWVVDASRLTTRVPNLTDLPGRTGWDSSWIFSTGIAIHWGQ
jgi:hypothetical protein